MGQKYEMYTMEIGERWWWLREREEKKYDAVTGFEACSECPFTV